MHNNTIKVITQKSMANKILVFINGLMSHFCETSSLDQANGRTQRKDVWNAP